MREACPQPIFRLAPFNSVRVATRSPCVTALPPSNALTANAEQPWVQDGLNAPAGTGNPPAAEHAWYRVTAANYPTRRKKAAAADRKAA